LSWLALLTVLKWLAVAIALVALAVVGAGRLGLLQGARPEGLGVHQGRLKPPSVTPNSVSSQAGLYPDHPRSREAQIAPLAFEGDGAAAFARLSALVEASDGARIVERRADYLYATYTTPVMRFVDDVEFWLDPAAGVIQVRSASRVGRGDLGLNRVRIEALRARFEAH
jgi:uncharacterized protein (DUF1499 family)